MTASSGFADLWEAIATVRGDQAAVVQGDRTVTWNDLDRRADGIADALLRAGLGHQAKVAQYLRNGPEYLESLFASYKAGLVPVNTNHRYLAAELVQLWHNADVEAVVFHGEFTDRVAAARHELGHVALWLWVDDGHGPCPDWARPYEDAASASPAGPVRAPWGRSGDDVLLLYTGGTTGLPKGVVWRQADYVEMANETLGRPYPHPVRPEEVRELVAGVPRLVLLPACPLMHGTGFVTAQTDLLAGGTVVLTAAPSFSATEVLDLVDRHRVAHLVIVGDVMGAPLLEAFVADRQRWSLACLDRIASAGMMWSERNRRAWAEQLPSVELFDALGASEVASVGGAVSGGAVVVPTARFTLAPGTIVLDDDGVPVPPGSPVVGRLATSGRLPLGYYGDAEATARAFVTIDGTRYGIAGDHATVEADGTVRLIGRGSVCINTGGEKVYPEEVEEVLKEHATVRDAVVVGAPDERTGQAVVGVVEPQPGETLDEATLIAFVKARLAGYKAPRRIVAVDSIGRGPNGKADLPALQRLVGGTA